MKNILTAVFSIVLIFGIVSESGAEWVTQRTCQDGVCGTKTVWRSNSRPRSSSNYTPQRSSRTYSGNTVVTNSVTYVKRQSCNNGVCRTVLIPVQKTITTPHQIITSRKNVITGVAPTIEPSAVESVPVWVVPQTITTPPTKKVLPETFPPRLRELSKTTCLNCQRN